MDKRLCTSITIALFVLLTMLGCTQHHALLNGSVDKGTFYGSTLRNVKTVKHLSSNTQHTGKKQTGHAGGVNFASNADCSALDHRHLDYHYRTDQPLLLSSDKFANRQQMSTFFSDSLPLSPGDMVELTLTNGDGFSGRYIINPDGRIQLPLIKAIDAAGLQLDDLANQIELALVRKELFRANSAKVGLRVLLWAPIEVSVSGAVFEPGRVLINKKSAKEIMPERIAAFGDYTPSRYLSEALRAASGIRPDAKLDQILLIRNGWQLQVDLSGILSGQRVNDISLVAGDQIIVPTTGCFQAHLVRPSQITPKGFRVFMSNLTVTARSNSSAAIGRFSSSLPYGTRLLQAAVSANCVGGTSWTNAPRRVLLASKNPLTGLTEVIERSVEQLVRQAEFDDMNPYLMPNDAVACYDSDITNFRDVARTVLDLVSPVSNFRVIER